MALETVHFKTDEELVDAIKLSPYSLYANSHKEDIFTQMPVETQMGLNPPQPYFQPFEHPEIKKEEKESPGFFSTFGHEFSENNELFEAARTISRVPEHLNALSDPVPDDWTPYNVESLQDIDKPYWNYIFDSVSPNDLEARRKSILSKQKEDEAYNDGSVLAKFLGGATGYLAGPSSILFPISASIKYAKVSQQVIQNTLRHAPELALQSVAHNAFMEGNRVGGNMQDFLVNSAIDATAGIVLTGGAAGFAHVVTGGQLFNARKALKLNYDGIEIKLNINEDGEIDKFSPYRASPLEGESLSAAYVDSAQLFLDSKMAKEGLFKLVPGLTKLSGWLSPTVRMMNSSFSTASEFMNRLVDHSIVTVGLAKGQPQGNNFERMMWGVFSDAKQVGWLLEGLRKEANGVETGGAVDKATKSLLQRMAKGKSFIREEFGKEVANVIRTGTEHSNKAINQAASILNTHLEKTYKSFLKAYDLSEEIFPPRTAIGYLMRNYNQDAVNTNLDTWITVVSNALKQQDILITKVQKPLTKARNRVQNLKSLKQSGIKNDAEILNQLEEAEAEVEKQTEILNHILQDDETLHIVLEKRNFLDSKQRQELRSLLEPLKKQQELIDKQKLIISEKFNAVKEHREIAVRTSENKVKSEAVQKKQKTQDELQSERDKLKELEDEYINLQEELKHQALEGEINQRYFLYNKESNQVNFRDPDEMPKLRSVYESDEARRNAAIAYRETIMNVTPEQIGRQMLSSISGGNLENPLGVRSLMIPDTVLQNAGFLSNDISKNVALYDMILGKKTAFKTIYGDFGTGDGIEGVSEALAQERRMKEAEIENLPENERVKARRKLNKEFDFVRRDIKNAYDHAMGNSKARYNSKFRAFSKGLRDFAISTRLGAVPLTMITDIGGSFLNNSVIEVIRDGFIPAAKTFNGLIKSKEGIHYRESSAHLFIATEHLGNAYAEKMWNSSTMSDVAVGGKIANGLDSLAHFSGNLFGTNYIDNFVQRMTANITQSKIMNYMFKFKDGKLSEKELLILNKFGINPKEWADRFINSFEEVAGEKSFGGGYQSAYYLWKDQEASLRMGNAIRSGVRASILKKGLGDAPFWTNDPAFGLLTYLKGWAFSAFTRYTVPTMQRFDADNALGLGVMLLMGSLVDPLRKWSRGEEYDFENKSKFSLDALNNSGVLGIMTDVIQDLNAFTHGEFLTNMSSDRYRERTLSGILGGPLGGIAEDVSSVFTSFASGKINQQDMNKFIRLIPLTQAWYLRYLSNKLVEAMDLPKNRNHAEGWFEKG